MDKITFKGYQGAFFKEEVMKRLIGLQKKGLADVVNDMHITFNFGEILPFPDELMEKDISFKVIGYASDGKNSGFQVEMPEELKLYYKNVNRPHITVSLGEVDGVKGKPVDTGTLNFEKIDEPFEISGQLGYFIFDKGIIMDNSIFTKSHTASEIIEDLENLSPDIKPALKEILDNSRERNVSGYESH